MSTTEQPTLSRSSRCSDCAAPLTDSNAFHPYGDCHADRCQDCNPAAWARIDALQVGQPGVPSSQTPRGWLSMSAVHTTSPYEVRQVERADAAYERITAASKHIRRHYVEVGYNLQLQAVRELSRVRECPAMTACHVDRLDRTANDAEKLAAMLQVKS